MPEITNPPLEPENEPNGRSSGVASARPRPTVTAGSTVPIENPPLDDDDLFGPWADEDGFEATRGAALTVEPDPSLDDEGLEDWFREQVRARTVEPRSGEAPAAREKAPSTANATKAAKKSVASKTGAKVPPARRSARTKTAAKAPAARTPPAKKSAPTKTTPTEIESAKTAAKKTGTKTASAEKTSAKRTSAKKSTRGRG